MTAPIATDEPAWPSDAIEVGRIIGAWGIKGGIRVKPFSSDPQALFSSKRWFIRPSDQPVVGPKVAAQPLPNLFRVIEAREQGEHVVARVQEVADRTAAEGLKGVRIFVSRGSFPTADADEFYWVDLIGLAVFNRSGVAMGTVTGLLETGAHCVLQVRAIDALPEAAPLLIPFVSAYVGQVDLAAKRIDVDWELDF